MQDVALLHPLGHDAGVAAQRAPRAEDARDHVALVELEQAPGRVLELVVDRLLPAHAHGQHLPGARRGEGLLADRHVAGELQVAHAALAAPAHAGRLEPRNASYVLALLDAAMSGAVTHEFDAIVTAPVQKSVINEAGIAFSGHTEYLAAHSGIARPVMLLVAGSLRVALATTHLPLREVSATITKALLREVLDVLATDLARLFGLARPRILVCGVNPHAGEAGHLGREELDVIAPALADARARGLDVTGPVPADTAFVPAQLAGHDAVLAMYHDQGLPVLKHAGFGRAVNVTLGLP
ncbi:MAG: 4-hydroxythreonine-4-phosphate dehydrogenase PdxA, partial [Planctomycetota bacterium]|nr:4-hydroxythreonine-4-phosphate dehydrogenase PdxA [Planctomycetota bacterium]